jgi:hypothetical protein
LHHSLAFAVALPNLKNLEPRYSTDLSLALLGIDLTSWITIAMEYRQEYKLNFASMYLPKLIKDAYQVEIREGFHLNSDFQIGLNFIF